MTEDEENVEMEVMAQSDGYVSVGLSEDMSMVGCSVTFVMHAYTATTQNYLHSLEGGGVNRAGDAPTQKIHSSFWHLGQPLAW